MLRFILIIALIVLSALFLIYLNGKTSHLSTKKRGSIALFAVSVIFILMFFTFFQDNNANKKEEIIISFNQGKTILCGEQNVSRENFIYVSQSQSFSGKRDNNFSDFSFGISSCKI